MAPTDGPGPGAPGARALYHAGDRHSGRVTDVAFGGEGVVRLDDFVCFVPFSLVGEVVEFELTEVKRQFARGRLLRVIEPSPDRVEPRCAYFGVCGGCQYQHLAYPAQLAAKHRQIAGLFQRIGGLSEARIDPVIPCPSPYEYRNRLMIRSWWNKERQGLDIGFLRTESRVVVDVEDCVIAEPAVREQIRRVRANPPPKGGLKVVLRQLPEGWDVPGDSFFQNNSLLLPRLVETVRARLAESGSRHLIDAYCGVGFFSVELGDLVESFVGVEVDRRAVEAARRNAAGRGLTNGEYRLGVTEELLPGFLTRWDPRRVTVILDPPRTGCHPTILEALRAVRPAQIIYVSCHPATLARDVRLLVEGGDYRLDRVTPLDMFPQTQHVECVADVRLRVEGAAETVVS